MNLPAHNPANPLQPIDSQTLSTPTPPGPWCVRHSSHEVIAHWIPDGATIRAAKILVLGDVGRDATLFAEGGGRIDVMGNVHEGARIAALGGGAHILIRGAAANGVQVYAYGGGSRIVFLRASTAYATAEGGGAEVLYLPTPTDSQEGSRS